MSTKKWNWRLWVGFAIAVLALVVYLAVVFRMRDVFWLSVALFVVSIALLASGFQRAYRHREAYRGRVAGPILAVCGALVLGLFGLASYQISKHFAAAENAPKIGQAAPQFTLVDSSGHTVSLAAVLASPAGQSGTAHAPRAALLIFYRGYW